MRNAAVCVVLGLVLACLSLRAGAVDAGTAAAGPPSVTWRDYRVEVNEHGNLGRIYLKRGFDEIDAMLERANASGVVPNVWRVALVLVPTFDVTWKDSTGQERHTVATLKPEWMDNARASIKKYAQWVRAFTGGHLAFELSEFVFQEPVVLVMGPEQKGPFFPPPLKDEMVAAFPDWKPEQTDSVICVFPPGDMQLDAFGRSWGQLHGPLRAGNANIAYLDSVIGPDAGMVYVMLHEWLHQAESVMMDNLGYMGLPALHDAEQNGYGVNDLEIPEWTCWYRDLMFRLYRPAMWDRADMNAKLWTTPGPDFEGGYITQWLVRGSFSNEGKEAEGLDDDFLGGESGVLPSAADETAFPVKDNAAWHAFDMAAQYEPLPETATDEQRAERAAAVQIVDFTRAFDPNTTAVGYAHVYIRATKTQEVLLWIGSDDGVKVWLNGLVVHRNRVDRGVTKDSDRVPVMLMKGWNRLLVKVDQGVGGWGFSARFSTPGGQPIEALTMSLELPAGAKTEPGVAVPVEWDGKLYAWSDVQDDAWAKLPRLDERMLRAMMGLESLTLDAEPGILRIAPGERSPVVSPVLAQMDRADARLNNQLTYANESLAWLRCRTTRRDSRFESDRRDVLLIRWDLIEPWLDWIESHSTEPAERSLAGYVAVGRQVAYVVYTDLGEAEPARELDLVTTERGGVVASVALERAASLTAKIVQGRVRVENTTAEPVTLKRIGVACDAAGVEGIVRSPIVDAPIEPGGEIEEQVPLLQVAAGAPPGLKKARVQFELQTAAGPEMLERWVALDVMQPVGIDLAVNGPSIVKSGATREATLVLTNNAAHLGKVTWRVAGRGVRARPASEQITLRPLPKQTTTDLALRFGRTRRSGTRNVVVTVDVAEGTVPDSRAAFPVYVGGAKALFRYDFEKGLDDCRYRSGTYSVEHVRGRGMRGRGYALIKDGGGGRYGNILIFGPDRGKEADWHLAYSSDEYPMIEFMVAAKDTVNTGVIIRADDKWYGLVITGAFADDPEMCKVIGTLGFEPDGTVHTVRFNLDEALDAAAGAGDHAIQEIWIGERRNTGNRDSGPDVGTLMLDEFTVR